MQKIATLGLLALLLAGAAAAPAGARGGTHSGSGVIEDVSFDEGTVTLGTRTFEVTPRTEFRTSTGTTLTFSELEDDWVGERAIFDADAGHPRPVLRSLLVDDPDSDD